MQLYPLKHVTIVAETILKDQLTHKVLDLGATGFTCIEVAGDGSRDARSVIAGENLKLDIICPDEVAQAILTYISHNLFENYGCIAWVTDVSVVRGSHYLKRK
jgi:nitrogen regulatory protein P-II 2